WWIQSVSRILLVTWQQSEYEIKRATFFILFHFIFELSCRRQAAQHSTAASFFFFFFPCLPATLIDSAPLPSSSPPSPSIHSPFLSASSPPLIPPA
uniref:Uncharacterized protein n=1 Tax=Aegilops tauschii subsp. strangulata TaxID=200361 RepID=A0A453Q8M7_AEGTS